MGKRESDEYDEQIARLTDHPELIEYEWANGLGLFKTRAVSDNRRLCLTEMKCWPRELPDTLHTNPVVQALLWDNNIPRNPDYITVDSLPHFKAHCEKFDEAGIR